MNRLIRGLFATMDRFARCSLTIMGGLYLLGAHLSPEGVGMASIIGFVWAAIGLFVGDPYWGWRGLLAGYEETNDAH